MAIEIYMRDMNSSDGFLLHTAETIEEVKATIKHVQETCVYLNGAGESTRDISTQYVVDNESAYFEIVVG